MSRAHRISRTDLLIPTNGTAYDSLTQSAPVTSTAEDSIDDASGHLRLRVADLRDQVALLASDVDGAHHQAQDYDLQQRSQVKARMGVSALLSELATARGMSWSSIAKLVGVSVAAVRKWRHDGAATGENRKALARLAAFLDLLEEFTVQDPAGWLEIPLLDGYTLTASTLYRARMEADLLDFASTRTTVQELAEKFDPEWRRAYVTDFEVFEAEDGNLAVRRGQRMGDGITRSS